MSVLSLEAEIATYLQGLTFTPALNFSGAGDKNLFAAAMPDVPDIAVGIIATPGMAPVMTLTGSGAAESRIDRASFQVRVRADMNNFVEGQQLTQAIYKALQGIVETVLVTGGSLYHLITALQPPRYLGRGEDVDMRQRPNWAQNFVATMDNAQR